MEADILDKLKEIKVEGHSLHILNKFLTNRTFQVRYNGHFSKTMTQDNGIPQGSAISPTLFLLAINDIVKEVAKGIPTDTPICRWHRNTRQKHDSYKNSNKTETVRQRNELEKTCHKSRLPKEKEHTET